MHIPHSFIITSPLVIPSVRETNLRLTPVLGNSMVLINIALMYVQQVLFVDQQSLESQIELMVDNISPDLLYMYVSGDESLIPSAKTKLKEDITFFIYSCENFFRRSSITKELITVVARYGMYIRANHVIDDVAPHITVTVVKRF